MFKMCSAIFFISMISFSLHASENQSYEKAFQELSTTPVSQLDFRIQQLEYRIKKFKKTVIINFKDSYNSDFQFGFTSSIKCCEKVYCYQDKINPLVVVCEVLVDYESVNSYEEVDIKKRYDHAKFTYQTILELSKATIHESFDKSNLRIIVKREKPIKEKDFPENEEDLEGFVLSYQSQEEILVIWENGIPFYQDAFFAE